MNTPLRLGQMPDGLLRIKGHDAEIDKLMDEHARRTLREAELVSDGFTEDGPTSPLSLTRMRLRSVVHELKWHLSNTRELRALSRLPPHIIDQMTGRVL